MESSLCGNKCIKKCTSSFMDEFFDCSLKMKWKHAHFFQLFFNSLIKVIVFFCVFEQCMEHCNCYNCYAIMVYMKACWNSYTILLCSLALIKPGVPVCWFLQVSTNVLNNMGTGYSILYNKCKWHATMNLISPSEYPIIKVFCVFWVNSVVSLHCFQCSVCVLVLRPLCFPSTPSLLHLC